MKTAEYEIVEYSPALLDGILRLQTYLWGLDEACNRRYFAWKYEENPYGSEPLIYIALHRGEVVAMRGVYSARWEIGGASRTVAGACAGDTVVAPEHRGRGLFRLITNKALTDLKRRGHEYVLALSTGRATRLLTLRSGGRRLASYGTMGRYAVPWRHPSVTEMLRSPRAVKWSARVRAMLSRFQSRPAERAASTPLFRALDLANEKEGQPTSARITITTEPRPQDMASLAKRGGQTGRIRQVGSPAFFAWRFRNPRSAYRFVYWDHARLQGYLVFEASRVGSSKTVHLVDWHCPDAEVAYQMLRATMAKGRFPAVETWSLSVDPTMRGALVRAGFRHFEETDTRSHPAAGPLIIPTAQIQSGGDLHCDDINILDAANWEFRMIWSDSH